MKINKKFILVFIFIIAFILRFYKLGEIPSGLYQDETAIGYNAFSLLQTGQDEHGVRYPLYFKSFGDYKLPVYIYLTGLSVKLSGLTPLAVRLPSAICGFFSVILFYLVIKIFTKNETLSMLAAAALAINPWHVHYSRASFEVTVCLLFYLAGLYLFGRTISGKKWAFLLSTLCFLVTLYGYNLTRLLSPLFFFTMIYIYRSQLNKISRPEKILTTAVSILLLIPFLITIMSPGGVNSAGGTLITSSSAIRAPLLELKSYAAGNPVLSKILLNIPVLTLWQYLNNIAAYFSVVFFFISGPTHGNHGIGNVGLFYLSELPLIVIGIYFMWKNLTQINRLLLSWGILNILVAAATRDVPQATRSFFLLPTLITALAYSAIFILKTIKSKIFYLGLGLLVLFEISYYLFSYYVRFPVYNAKSWRSADMQLGKFLQENSSKYDRVIIDNKAGFIYSSVLFYTRYPPDEFIRTAIWSDDDSEGFSFPVRFGKYEYRTVDWNNDIHLSNTLIISGSDQTSIRPADFVFYYPQRPVVIAVKQEILSYPVQEIAYVAFDTRKTLPIK